MTKYTSKELRINLAKEFKEALSHSDGRASKNSTILYAVLGRSEEYADESTVPTPIETVQDKEGELWRQAIGGKRITADDVSHVIPRHDWTINTTYSMYRDRDANLYNREFYVLTDEDNIYKCLNNNKGALSTVKPTGFSTTAFTLSDGYTWKYMYSISLGRAQKFLTPSYIPVDTLSITDGTVQGDRQILVQNAAVNGAIEFIETNQVGSGYLQVLDATATSATSTTVTLSSNQVTKLLPTDNIYNGSSLYVIRGTGSGQLRRIIDYTASTRTLTVNTGFTLLPNTDSLMIVSPTVTVVGDGSGAKAYSRVDVSDGSIANVFMITSGTHYHRAKAYITANSSYGTGATANVIISPAGGHGSNPIRELGGDKLLFNAQISGVTGQSNTGNGYIPANTDFRTVSLLKDPVLKVDANNETQAVESIANTSNSPDSLRFTTRLTVSYNSMDGENPVNEIVVGETLTNERTRLKAELGTLQFVTEIGTLAKSTASMTNAVLGANADVVYVRNDENPDRDSSFYTVYINNVEGYADNLPFTKDDIILKRGSDTEIATISVINGPEANTFSGEFLHTQNLSKVTRDVESDEDIKIILDF
jgi:hypothetical protein